MSRSAAQKETTVWAKLPDKLFLLAIKANTVPDRLDLMDGLTKMWGSTEQSVMADAVELLERGEHGKDAALFIAHNLLWAACRCPAGKAAERAARKGGKSIGWNMAYDTDGRLLYGLHVLDGSVRRLSDVRHLPDARDVARVAKAKPMMCVTGSKEAVGELAESMGAIAIRVSPDEVTPDMAASMLTLAEGTATAH